jgi:hypothetical protein
VFEPVIEADLGLSADEIETALIENNRDLARIHIALLKVVPLSFSITILIVFPVLGIHNSNTALIAHSNHFAGLIWLASSVLIACAEIRCVVA